MLLLENSILRAAFDDKTGALTELTYKTTGWNLNRRGQLGLSFRMQVPLPQRRKNFVLGEEQTLAQTQVSGDGKTITFTWRGLKSQHAGQLDITFVGTVTLDDKGLRFEASVTNRSELTIEGIAWPCVGDVTAPTGGKLQRLTGGYSGMTAAEILPNYTPTAGYWGTDGQVRNDAGNNGNGTYMLLQGESQGIYVGIHEQYNKHLVRWWFDLKPGFLDYYTFILPRTDEISGHTVHMEFMNLHFPYVHPGETLELSPIVMQPYQGNWQQGMDLYLAWRNGWFRYPKYPQWVTDVHSWIQLQPSGAEDDLRYLYKDLPQIAQQCAKHGISAIQLTGWNNGGQDRGNPSHDTDPRLGTWQELKDAIAQCHKLGVRVVLFNKYTWADASQGWYQKEGIKHAAKDPFGLPYPGHGYAYQTWTQVCNIGVRPLVPMCHASPDYRAYACTEFKKSVDLGAAGILYDESQHHHLAQLCFDRTHKHRLPAFVFGYDNQLIREFKQLPGAAEEEFLYCGEACYDFELQEYHVSYARMCKYNFNHLPRYLNPRVPLMMAIHGWDDRNQINKCLQHRYIMSYEPFNFKGLPDDFPLTMEYGKKVDAFRRQYRQLVWDADYRDVLGACVTSDGKKYEDYSVFHREGGKRAVVLANMDPDKPLQATVAFEGGAQGREMMADPENPDARPCTGQVTVPPRSAVVVFEE